MKVSYIFSLLFFLIIYKNTTTNVVHCGGYSDLAATSALTTIVKDPIRVTHRRKPSSGDAKCPVYFSNLCDEYKALREIWDQCTIAVYNNTLYAIESKPLLFLHGILNECKNNFSTKLRQDPGLIVAKIDQILKSQIYRFWVSEPYLKIGKSSIFYTRINSNNVPPLPKECTLKHLSSYMEEKLKSMESKKNIESGKYEFDVESTKNTTDDSQADEEDDDENEEDAFEEESFEEKKSEEKKD
ncbi:exported protein 2 [Plasmodium cynomolgi strain B]|uniref:Exported protein 2 n=1 Tax=Plasmodium cynomolgi (strain B) TaxID=1120755 RepID=K6ULN4_PLACD|nr:exported protein 2 [Plasmodium cynomolgi strain B]GAB67873.1 exported protein 2 [Plasmodium cynomolgi strain B]